MPAPNLFHYTNDKTRLSDLILSILSNKQDLTAKQIYYFIKKNFEQKYTYQAVHKTVKDLATKGVLKKEDKFYSIDSNWIQRIETFIEKTKDIEKKDVETLIKLPTRKVNKKIKVISFDLDGCLSDNTFDDLFWDREIPRLVAEKKNISFEEAYKFVVSEYERLWGKVQEWRNPTFWLKHFRISESWEDIIKDLQKEIKHYGDAIPVLKKLRKDYIVIITSHADRIFLDLKLNTEKLGGYLNYTFSAPNDFGSMKKDAEVYKKVVRALGIKPNEIVHIGDNYEFDYAAPTSIGIRSFLIDRSGKLKEDYVVRSLYEFEKKINSFSD